MILWKEKEKSLAFFPLPPTPPLKKLLKSPCHSTEKPQRMGALNFLMGWFNMLWLRWFATCVGEQSPEVCWKAFRRQWPLWGDPGLSTEHCFLQLGVSGLLERPSSGSVSVAQVTHSVLGKAILQTSDLYLWNKEADSIALRFPSKCMGFLKAQDQG